MSFLRRDRPEEPPLSFEEIASSLRVDNADLPLLLKQLADKLQADLGPDMVFDSRAANGLDGYNRRAPIKEITVKFGSELTFLLKYDHGVIETATTRGRFSSFTKEQLTLSEWLVGIHRAALALSQERTEELSVLGQVLTSGLEGLDERPQLDELGAAPAVTAENASTAVSLEQ